MRSSVSGSPISGLARIRGDSDLTASGDVLGTLRYLSPEQAKGRREAVDCRSDVYALGATLYELLTLRPVYEGDDRAELLIKIVSDEPRFSRKRDAAIPLDLKTIVLKALAKDPAERYATAGELAVDLTLFLADQPIRARPPTLGVASNQVGQAALEGRGGHRRDDGHDACPAWSRPPCGRIPGCERSTSGSRTRLTGLIATRGKREFTPRLSERHALGAPASIGCPGTRRRPAGTGSADPARYPPQFRTRGPAIVRLALPLGPGAS